jgi:arylsulfatase A-like enzyme
MKLWTAIFALSLWTYTLEAKKPNFVFIFADDLGYGDLACYGSKTIKTPNIDRMAKEGLKLNAFYAQTVCGPSRAALMTGSYPMRVATSKNTVMPHPRVHADEITIAEVLKTAGYKSIAVGKWSIAGQGQRAAQIDATLLPTRQGFDRFFGTGGSNDSIVNLIRGVKTVEEKADMSQLSKRYTDEAIGFIKENKDKPFFVYLAHTMPHVKLAASADFKGKSAAGLYGDVVEEIDFNLGRVLDTLKEEGLDDNTYLIFTSDNGPWFLGNSKSHLKRYGKNAEAHGGSADPLRGHKTSAWEGGFRVPFIVRAPGKVPAGSESDAVTGIVDILPTMAKLAAAELPTDRVIDGRDLSPLFHGNEIPALKNRPYFFIARKLLFQL